MNRFSKHIKGLIFIIVLLIGVVSSSCAPPNTINDITITYKPDGTKAEVGTKWRVWFRSKTYDTLDIYVFKKGKMVRYIAPAWLEKGLHFHHGTLKEEHIGTFTVRAYAGGEDYKTSTIYAETPEITVVPKGTLSSEEE